MSTKVYFALDGSLYRCSRSNLVRLLADKAKGKLGGLFCDYNCEPVESQLITVDGWDSSSLMAMARDQQNRIEHQRNQRRKVSVKP